MAIIFDGPVSPDALTEYVRNVPTPVNQVLNQILPDRMFSQNKIDVSVLTRRGRTARFRAYDADVHVTSRDTAVLSTVKLPPLSDSITQGELETLELEMARSNGSNMQPIIDQIYDDAGNLTRNIQRRMELARGDVLADGVFTLAGEGGLTLTADYQVPSANKPTAGVLWSDTANSDPLSDLYNWVYAYTVTMGNGFAPEGLLLSRSIQNYLLNNTKIRTATGSVLGINSSVTLTDLNSVFVARGIPPLLPTYDTAVDVDGTRTPVLPANKVIFVPPDPGENLGYTAWGVTATALKLANSGNAEMTFEEAPGIVGVIDQGDDVPYSQKVYVDAVGMPVINNPYALFAATVA
jgi:hypothetical protein